MSWTSSIEAGALNARLFAKSRRASSGHRFLGAPMFDAHTLPATKTNRILRSERTPQHALPADVVDKTDLRRNGWDSVALNMAKWRTASARPHLQKDPFGVAVGPSSHSYVELLTFQLATGVIVDGVRSEEPRFHNLVAKGYVKAVDAERVLRAWCQSGVIEPNLELVRPH